MVTPELDTVSIKGFKSIDSIENLPLKNMNVVIGPNGSGKSNFIGVFSFLHAVREGHLQDYVAKAGGAEKILHFGSKTTAQVWIEISFKAGVNGYELILAPNVNDQLIPETEKVLFWDKGRYPKPYDNFLAARGKEAGISDPSCKRVA